MKHFQEGAATLIVVLVMLIVITIIGTIAVRQSITSLNVATNSQVQQLLAQNSDSVYFNVEKRDNLMRSFTASGMFEYLRNRAGSDAELVFCYRGDTNEFFDINQASIIRWPEGANKPSNDQIGGSGYCNVSPNATINYFTSGRRAVVTQVAIKYPSSDINSQLFSTHIRGTDFTSTGAQPPARVKVFTVSVVPTLSGSDRGKINDCLSKHMNEVTIPASTQANVPVGSDERLSITQCLSKLNVPFSSNVTEYLVVKGL